jgi:hypothetical protein
VKRFVAPALLGVCLGLASRARAWTPSIGNRTLAPAFAPATYPTPSPPPNQTNTLPANCLPAPLAQRNSDVFEPMHRNVVLPTPVTIPNTTTSLAPPNLFQLAPGAQTGTVKQTVYKDPHEHPYLEPLLKVGAAYAHMPAALRRIVPMLDLLASGLRSANRIGINLDFLQSSAAHKAVYSIAALAVAADSLQHYDAGTQALSLITAEKFALMFWIPLKGTDRALEGFWTMASKLPRVGPTIARTRAAAEKAADLAAQQAPKASQGTTKGAQTLLSHLRDIHWSQLANKIKPEALAELLKTPTLQKGMVDASGAILLFMACSKTSDWLAHKIEERYGKNRSFRKDVHELMQLPGLPYRTAAFGTPAPIPDNQRLLWRAAYIVHGDTKIVAGTPRPGEHEINYGSVKFNRDEYEFFHKLTDEQLTQNLTQMTGGHVSAQSISGYVSRIRELENWYKANSPESPSQKSKSQ